MLEPVWVLPVTAVRRPPGRLDVSHTIRLRPQHPQKGGGIERACANFEVVGLLYHASPVGPELIERKYEFLKCHFYSSRVRHYGSKPGSRPATRPYSSLRQAIDQVAALLMTAALEGLHHPFAYDFQRQVTPGKTRPETQNVAVIVTPAHARPERLISIHRPHPRDPVG